MASRVDVLSDFKAFVPRAVDQCSLVGDNHAAAVQKSSRRSPLTAVLLPQSSHRSPLTAVLSPQCFFLPSALAARPVLSPQSSRRSPLAAVLSPQSCCRSALAAVSSRRSALATRRSALAVVLSSQSSRGWRWVRSPGWSIVVEFLFGHNVFSMCLCRSGRHQRTDHPPPSA